MVLSMGFFLEFNDVVDYFNYINQDYLLDLMDIENDEEYVCIFRGFQLILFCFCKWIYGVFFESEVVLEWRLWGRIYEQFELLGVVILSFCFVSIC